MLVHTALTAWCVTVATECAKPVGGSVYRERVPALFGRAPELFAGNPVARSEAPSTVCYVDGVLEV